MVLLSARDPQALRLRDVGEGVEEPVLTPAKAFLAMRRRVGEWDEVGGAGETWPEVSYCGLGLEGDIGGASSHTGLPPPSPRRPSAPRLADPMDCGRCGTTVAKKSIRVHEALAKCARLRRKLGWVPPPGTRAAGADLLSLQGKRLKSVPPGSGSPASGKGGKGKRRASRQKGEI